ncbi:hypothetical protein F5887DRAFT_992797 [Amanita rubescens]|nr:hypothetical protein F5887DRAFT_992797 [Amanita rubescens]
MYMLRLLKLRRKTASETLRPFVTDLTKVACTNGEACSIDQCRSLIQRMCRLVQVVNSWGKAVTGSSEEHSSCNALLMDTYLWSVRRPFARVWRNALSLYIIRDLF